MATRTCPSCGAQYVASVRLCIDCNEPLVEDAPDRAPAQEVQGEPERLGRPDGEHVLYDLVGWGNSLKVSLAGILERAAVRHVWEAGALMVASADEEQVDEIIAGLGGVDAAEVGDDAELVAFEIEGLTGEDQEELDARLLAAGVTASWSEEGDLVVAEDDQDAVAEIIDEVLSEEPRDDGADGLAVNSALSKLFVATDRLARAPHERRTAWAYREAAAVLDGLGVPYGMALSDWRALVAETEALAALTEATSEEPEEGNDAGNGDDEEGVDDVAEGGDDVAEAAGALRERLRDMV